MYKLFTSSAALPERVDFNVLVLLVTHVYQQTKLTILAAIFCATVLFIGMFNVHANNQRLWVWAITFLLICFARLNLAHIFEHQAQPAKHILLWRNLYILGCLLGGLSWGVIGIYLFPYLQPMQQTLVVLMLAGVTAGGLTSSAGIAIGAILFLIFSIAPFILSIIFFQNSNYYLFDFALTLYLGYSIYMVIKSHLLIKNSFLLKFENDSLVSHLMEIKRQLEASNKMLEDAATHDPLTRAVNRSLFIENMEQAILHTKKTAGIFALLYLDIDNFKTINDHLGHHVGDLVLLTVISRIKKILEPGSQIARIGGDEFTVLLEHIHTPFEAYTLGKKLCEIAAEPVESEHGPLKITLSIGFSIYPNDAKDVETLIKRADQMMYKIKSSGGNACYGGDYLQQEQHQT
jgi:diguanylate cyclase (GGDEF)-like protein